MKHNNLLGEIRSSTAKRKEWLKRMGPTYQADRLFTWCLIIGLTAIISWTFAYWVESKALEYKQEALTQPTYSEKVAEAEKALATYYEKLRNN